MRGDVGEELNARREFDGDLDIGGATLASAFIRRGLIDEYRLVVHPVVIGAGTPFFRHRDALRLSADGQPTVRVRSPVPATRRPDRYAATAGRPRDSPPRGRPRSIASRATCSTRMRPIRWPRRLRRWLAGSRRFRARGGHRAKIRKKPRAPRTPSPAGRPAQRLRRLAAVHRPPDRAGVRGVRVGPRRSRLHARLPRRTDLQPRGDPAAGRPHWRRPRRLAPREAAAAAAEHRERFAGRDRGASALDLDVGSTTRELRARADRRRRSFFIGRRFDGTRASIGGSCASAR